MNRRDYKEFAPGCSYHVYNRGNGKMDLYRDEQDYKNFLWRLRVLLGIEEAKRSSGIRLTPCEEGAFSLISYCLMPNHFHFQLAQNREEPVSSLMLKLLTSYSKYFNRKYDHVGHVCQDRFKAVLVESDNQAAALSAYIHQNPVTAKLVASPGEWPYSSFREFATGKRDLVDADAILAQFENRGEYATFIKEQLPHIIERKELSHLSFDE